MKHAHFILGLAMLCVAGTVTAYIVMQPEPAPTDPASANRPDRAEAVAPNAQKAPAAKSTEARLAILLGGVEAPTDDPLLVEQARLVETDAHRRLADLAAQLDLTRKQQARIFPLLARSSPDYDPRLVITGRRGRDLVAPVSRRDADREIYDLLDAGQQAALDLAEAEKTLWWSSVIARLERDLNNSAPAPQSDPAPDSASDPATATPPDPQPAAAPATHRGRSLFDR